VFVNNVELMGSSQPKGNETQKATDPAEGDDLPF